MPSSLCSPGLWLDCFLSWTRKSRWGRMESMPGMVVVVVVGGVLLVVGAHSGVNFHLDSHLQHFIREPESCRPGKMIGPSPSIRPSHRINCPCHLQHNFAACDWIHDPLPLLLPSLSLSLSLSLSMFRLSQDTSPVLSQATEPSYRSPLSQNVPNVIKV